MAKGIKKVCRKGHVFYRSSDCPTCPICEKDRRPSRGFLAILAAPARRALESAGITTLKQLSQWSEKEILELHGMGPSSIPKLRKALSDENRSFRRE
jgi:predicted RecB family nuclease